jgi:hypothetical protein
MKHLMKVVLTPLILQCHFLGDFLPPFHAPFIAKPSVPLSMRSADKQNYNHASGKADGKSGTCSPPMLKEDERTHRGSQDLSQEDLRERVDEGVEFRKANAHGEDSKGIQTRSSLCRNSID